MRRVLTVAVVVAAVAAAGCGTGSHRRSNTAPATSAPAATGTSGPDPTSGGTGASGSAGTGSAAPGPTPSAPRGQGGSTAADPKAADAALVLDMYDTINRAFQAHPDNGVRAVIAAQYPGDRADVDFARCVDAIVPGAKTLPRSKRLHFSPNVATMTPDPGYTLTSNRVRGLHPKGRIYVTEVTISDGTRPTVRERHQVVLSGRAYQFSSC